MLSDYISPEEIARLTQRTERQRQVIRDWLIWLVVTASRLLLTRRFYGMLFLIPRYILFPTPA